MYITRIGPPDNPTFSGTTDLTENVMSGNLTCTAAGAFSAGGSITWYNNNTLIQAGGGNYIPNGTRFDIQDTLCFVPSRSDNQNAIRCEARHGTLTSPPYPASETTIDVKCMYLNV